MNINEIKQNFLEKKSRVSYSKYKQFNTCEASWFATNFLPSGEGLTNHRYAIAGTIIQRIFQELINKKIYLQYKTTKMLKAWIRDNICGMFYSIYFPIDSQYTSIYLSRNFFLTIEGASRLAKNREKFPLFSIEDDLSPNFIEKSELVKDHISIPVFLEKLYNITVESCFNFLEVDLNDTVSEVYLRHKTPEGVILSGKIDFIEKDYTKNSFFLFDGKFNLNSFADPSQLFFYSYLIYKSYKTLPYKLGFLGWKENKFKEIEFKKEAFDEIEYKISIYQNRLNEIDGILNSIKCRYINIEELINLLNVKSSFLNCKFCCIKPVCESAYKK